MIIMVGTQEWFCTHLKTFQYITPDLKYDRVTQEELKILEKGEVE